jgi:DNA-binding IclR family transcriptional regulator
MPRSSGLSSARAVLRVLSLLAQAPDGLRAHEIAQALGKSVSTAYSLLDTLCQEHFVVHSDHGAYLLTSDAAELAAADADVRAPAGLEGVLDEVFARTHKRAYLAAARSGQVVIPLERGRQGMPRIPGLKARIRTDAHALALGKVALSLLPEAALDRYLARGLRPFTAHTIVQPERLRAELDEIRAGAVAFDREEFGEDVCCLAAPIFNARGSGVAAVGISMSVRCFELERDALSDVLRDVTDSASRALSAPAVPAIPEDAVVLDRSVLSALGSPSSRRAVPVPTEGEVVKP